MKSSAFFPMLLTSTVVWGGGLCTQNPLQVDVCGVATTISETIAEELPLRLNRNLVLQDIRASDNLVRMSAVFDYTEAHFTQSLSKDATLDTMRESVRDTAMAIACRPKTQLQAFIQLGGRLQFVYHFLDKTHFLTVNVDHCTSELG